MVKISSVIAFFSIVLLGWYGIHAVVGLLFGVPLYSSVFLCVAFIPFALLLVKKGISLVEWSILPILLIWVVYAFFFLYHAKQFPGIASQYGLLNPHLFMAQTLECLVLAAIFKKEIVDMDAFLYRVYVTVSLLSVFVFVILFAEYGWGFIYREGFLFGAGVSLITYSYNTVFGCILGFYLLTKLGARLNKKRTIVVWSFFVYSVTILVMMGKRGALLSLVIPILSYFFFKRLSVKRAILYLGMIVAVYFVVIANIDTLFDFLSFFSNRLADQCRLAYYAGDTNGRDYIWEIALEQFNRNRMFGYFPRIIDINVGVFFYGLHPHNYYLESLMTMGLVGSVPFFGYMVYILLFKYYKAVQSNSTYTFWALLFVSELIHGTFSSPLNNSIIWVTIFVLSRYTPEKNGAPKLYG